MKKQNLNLLNLSCLEKFIGHNVFIQNEDADVTYLYHNLLIDYDTYSSHLVLIDGENGCRTWIPFDFIRCVASFSEDLYVDVVEINAQYDWKICCAEERPILPKCHKCGKEINFDESIWGINGMANYGSHYDDPEENMILNGYIHFCDDCLYGFVGDIEVGKFGIEERYYNIEN